MNDHARRQRIRQSFAERFGGEPRLWCRAPGRVDLMGSHTDYNLGAVLTLPIDRDVWIAAHPNHSRQVNLHSLNLGSGGSFDLDSEARNPAQPWLDYVHGVALELRQAGLPPAGFDGVVHGTVPLGGGLSSSAALECAAATVFQQLGGWRLAPLETARLCQRAENRFVGVNCGILDQFTSCMGRQGCALLLDCRDLSSRPVAVADDLRVVICDTRSKRELAGSEYGERRAQCEHGARLLGAGALREVDAARFQQHEHRLPPDVARRCRFIIEEHARVLELADALPGGDRAAIRRLTAGSFEGARLLYQISSPAMEAMMEAMLAAPGVIGARQAGAGFGGCMVALVEAGAAGPFAAAVRARYAAAAGIEPEVFPVTAAAGAGMI